MHDKSGAEVNKHAHVSFSSTQNSRFGPTPRTINILTHVRFCCPQSTSGNCVVYICRNHYNHMQCGGGHLHEIRDATGASSLNFVANTHDKQAVFFSHACALHSFVYTNTLFFSSSFFEIFDVLLRWCTRYGPRAGAFLRSLAMFNICANNWRLHRN